MKIGGLLFLLAGLGRAVAQAPPAVTEIVSVRVMDLDVVVLDRNGRRVPDLSQEDFHVKVDRKPVPIDYFAAVNEGVVHAPDLSALSPDLVLKQYEKGQDAYVPRHFLIFLDSANLSPGEQKRALEGLRDLIIRLGVSDDALLLLENRHPKILADWTSSKETLFAALDAAAGSGGAGLRRGERERQAMREIDLTHRISSRISQARLYQEEAVLEVKRMLGDATQALSLLAGRPGKRAFLDVSGGFEIDPGSAMVAYAARSALPPPDFRQDVTAELDRFTDLANAMEVTVYTADARGILAPGIDASNEPTLSQVSFFARQEMQAGLLRMADETGGRALLNRNDLNKGFAAVLRDASAYYSVGVNLKNIPARGPHGVEVSVDRAGLTVRARKTYSLESEEERVEHRVISTLLTETSFADLDVAVRTAPARKEKGDYLLSVEVAIPARDVVFPPEGEANTVKVDYYLATVDDRNQESPIAHRIQSFTVPPAETRSSHPLVASFSLRLKKGNFRLIVNARDSQSGRMGTARANVHIE